MGQLGQSMTLCTVIIVYLFSQRHISHSHAYMPVVRGVVLAHLMAAPTAAPLRWSLMTPSPPLQGIDRAGRASLSRGQKEGLEQRASIRADRN